MSTLPPASRKSTAKRHTSTNAAKVLIGILRNEDLFGNAAPKWKQAPTADDAHFKRVRLIKRLHRFSHDFKGSAELAARLQTCVPRCRCRSGACPECGRAFQRWLVAQMRRFIRVGNRPKPGELVAVSITSPVWRSEPGHLDTFDLSKMRKEAIEAIEQTEEVQSAILGLDMSMNDDTEKGFGLTWQGQLYGFARVSDRRAFSKSLRRSFPRDERVTRPVLVKPCDGTTRAFSYAIKPEFVRRITFWGDGKTQTGEPRKCWRTRKVSLKAREEVELRLFLDQIGLSKRLLFCRLKVVPIHYGFRLNPKQLE